MPFQKLQFRPGIVRDVTAYTNEGGYYDCNLVRFRMGFPETMGGWQKVSSLTYLGSVRSLLNWVTLDGSNLLALGTNLKYYIEEGGQYFDITPIRKTVTLTSANSFTASFSGTLMTVTGTPTGIAINQPLTATGLTGSPVITSLGTGTGGAGTYNISPSQSVLTARTVTTGAFTATSGSTTVVVYNVGHGCVDGDFVTFSGAATLGGTITAAILNQEYQIHFLNEDTYSITVSVAANASDTGHGGSSVSAQYQINTGLDTQVGGVGWGAGTWGRGAWGSASTVSVGNSLRQWSQDNYGEDLIFNVRNGGVYYWYGAGGNTTRAVTLASLSTDTSTPDLATQIMISDRDRHVIAFGPNMGNSSAQDPLGIRFSDGEDPFTWYPSATNTAGDIRIGSGTKIVRAVETKREIVVFTDIAVYSMQYLGPPYTFGLQQLAANITINGYNSAIAVDDAVFWMGNSNFYVYAGQTQPLACPIQSYIFGDFNTAQCEKVYAFLNAQFNEVNWLYPSADSEENDRFVTYNYIDKAWTYGILSRTAWLDDGVRDYPVAAGTDGYLYNHELGTDDGSTNPPSAISSYIESTPFDIGDGDKFAFVRRIVPDLKFFNSTNSPVASLVLKTQNYNGSNYVDGSSSSVARTSTVPVDQYTNVANVRVRGRALVFRVESNRVGTRWGLGSPRLEIRPDGGR